MSQTDAITLVRAHGRSASSFQSLSAGLHYWFDDTREACVAYADLGNAWVTVGTGLAPHDRELSVMDAFAREGNARGRRVRFFATEGELPPASAFSALQIGEQPIWNPQAWPGSLSTRMRGQLRRDAKTARVQLRAASAAEIADPRSSTRRGIAAVVSHWLESRKVAPMGFMVDVDPWHLPQERRFFVAEQNGAVVATLIAIPVYARGGWFLETMLRTPDAPNGTVELLFDLAMRTFAAEGSTYVSFGLCPLSGATSPLLQSIRWLTRSFYNYDGLRKFKGKLGPSKWEPVYLVHPKRDAALTALWDAARAFMPGGIARFVWNTGIQRARETVRWMAHLGIVWVTMFGWLAHADWFASPASKLLRVCLEVLTVVGLLWLGKGLQRSRVLAVSSVAMSTFIVSCLQFAVRGGSDGLLGTALMGVGTLGSLLIAVFLFSCRGREQLYVVKSDAAPHGELTRPSAL